MSTEAPTLQAIYEELRSLNQRLGFVEDLVEEAIIRQLPRARASKRLQAEIKKAVPEMKAGKAATLAELRRA